MRVQVYMERVGLSVVLQCVGVMQAKPFERAPSVVLFYLKFEILTSRWCLSQRLLILRGDEHDYIILLLLEASIHM